MFQRLVVGGVGQHAQHAVAHGPLHAILALVHDQERNTSALQLTSRAPAYASETADDDMVLQLVDHFSGPPFPKILRELQLDDDLRHAAHRQQHHGYAKEYQKRIENPPAETQRMHFRVTHGGDGDQRHVEGVEGGVMLDPHEAQRSASDDQQNAAGQDDQPSTKAAHVQSLLLAVPHRLRASSTVMSSDSSGTPVHCRTASITLSMICASSRSAFFATSSISRSSPNISPYSFSGSVMPSV